MEKKRKPRFPMFVDLWSKKIIVVGGGVIASRRVNTLVKFADDITVVAKDILPELMELRDEYEFQVVKKAYEMKDIYGADIVLAATDDKAVNDEIYAVCKSLGILVNVCSDKSKCDFYFPAVIQEEELVIGLSASGYDHGKAKAAAREVRRFLQEKKMSGERIVIQEKKDDKIYVGSRESRLAVIQSELVMAQIEAEYPDLDLQLVTMKTTGDRILDRSLDAIGGKGLFVKELDRALLEDRTDLSVHSLKDMPVEIPEELPVLAYSKRENPRDVLVLPRGAKVLDLNLPIGCSSKRRVLQLQELYPMAEFAPIRGNVISRLEKLDRGEYAALVLAAAGLNRLGLQDRISKVFSTDEIIPSAGQGILAVQGRVDKQYPYLDAVNDPESAMAAEAERAFIGRLDGGCSAPMAAYARIKHKKLKLKGMYYHENSRQLIKDSIRGDCRQAHALGVVLAERILERAGESIDKG